MEKVLELVFKTADGGKKIISINAPKESLTAETVHRAMDEIIAADVFETSAGALTEKVQARLKNTEVTVLE